ncbi:hypothetical protein ACLKA7_008939 [Drosophila subpalustris]
MDLPKSEKVEGPTRRLRTVANFLEALLQDVFLYFVLCCLVLLMIWSVAIAVGDIKRSQKIHVEFPPTNSTNSNLVKHQHIIRRCIWPTEWCRLIFNCYRKRLLVSH